MKGRRKKNKKKWNKKRKKPKKRKIKRKKKKRKKPKKRKIKRKKKKRKTWRRKKSDSISEKKEETLNYNVTSKPNDDLECIRDEADIEKHVFEIKDIKIVFEKLKSVNDKRGFLINQESESKKEAENSFIEEVKACFVNDKDLKLIIEKYTKEFENRKDFFIWSRYYIFCYKWIW